MKSEISLSLGRGRSGYETTHKSTWSYEKRVSKHVVISLNSFNNFTELFAYVFFFVRLVVRDLCRSGCRQNFANFYLPAPLPSLPPSVFFFFFFFFSILPTVLLKHHSALSWLRCRLAVNISLLVTLRKVSRRASCKARRWDKVITIRRVCIV